MFKNKKQGETIKEEEVKSTNQEVGNQEDVNGQEQRAEAAQNP